MADRRDGHLKMDETHQDILVQRAIAASILGQGLDPADYVMKFGIDAYRKARERLSQPWLRWMINCCRVEYDLEHPVDRATAYDETMRTIGAIKKPALREKCAAIAQRELLRIEAARHPGRGKGADEHASEDPAPGVLTTAKLHAVYGVMVAHGLRLDERDYELLRAHGWSDERILPMQQWIQDPNTDEMRLRSIGVASAPSTWLALLCVCEWLSGIFDLTGVPGFYREDAVPQPESNAPDAAWELFETKKLFGPWRVKLHDKFGIPFRNAVLVPYLRGGLVVGLKVIPRINDLKTKLRGFLLSSRGLPCGSKAVAA